MNRHRTHNSFFFRAMQPLVLLLLLFAAGLQAQQTVSDDELPQGASTIGPNEEIPFSPEVITGELENGLRYFIRENSRPAGRAELRLVIRVGSILEEDSQSGLAHFLEHMAFNGTESFEKQELIQFMESIGMRLGPDINASTSFDETIYQLQLPTTNTGNLVTAFQIMGEWINGLTLDPEEIDLERGVVIEEWRLGQGAQGRIRDQQIPVLLKDSRYAERLPIGDVDNLRNFEHEELIRFYEDWYRPELMGIVAVGDFDSAEVEQMIRQQFGTIPPSPADAKPRPEYDIPEHEETLFSIISDPEVNLTQVGLIHKIPVEHDWTPQGYRQIIVERLYNNMLNTRFAEISRQPDAPFLAASSAMSSLAGPMTAYALSAVVEENGVERGLVGLLTEAERVARYGFSEEELERQKTSQLRAFEQAYINRGSRTSASLASELTRVYLDDEPMPGLAYELALTRRYLSEISVEEVNQVASNWITDENRVVSVITPENDAVVTPTEQELLAVMDSVSDADIDDRVEEASDKLLLADIPEGSPVVETREILGGITEWKLANGVRVLLKPTNFREDEIVFTGFSPGGSSIAEDEDYIAADSAGSIIANGGLGDFDAIELQRELTGKLASVSPFINNFEEGLTGGGSPADIETIMQLIYLRMTAPRADENYFALFNTQSRAVLQNRQVSPAQAFDDAFRKVFYQDHPRRQPPSVDMLDQLDLDKSLAFYQDRFADASDFTFIFVGNIDLEAFQPLVETYLGGLPGTGREESWVDRGVRNPTGVIRQTVRQGLEPQSTTRISFTSPFDIYDRVKRTQIQVLALVMETRLRNVMREQLGGTYGVSVGRSFIWKPVESYSLNISFSADPERVDELTDALFAELDKLKQEGPTESELADAKQALFGTYQNGLQSNRNWLTQILYATYTGVEPLTADIFAFPETLNSITLESTTQAFNDYLDMENYIHMTLLPETPAE